MAGAGGDQRKKKHQNDQGNGQKSLLQGEIGWRGGKDALGPGGEKGEKQKEEVGG